MQMLASKQSCKDPGLRADDVNEAHQKPLRGVSRWNGARTGNGARRRRKKIDPVKKKKKKKKKEEKKRKKAEWHKRTSLLQITLI